MNNHIKIPREEVMKGLKWLLVALLHGIFAGIVAAIIWGFSTTIKQHNLVNVTSTLSENVKLNTEVNEKLAGQVNELSKEMAREHSAIRNLETKVDAIERKFDQHEQHDQRQNEDNAKRYQDISHKVNLLYNPENIERIGPAAAPSAQYE